MTQTKIYAALVLSVLMVVGAAGTGFAVPAEQAPDDVGNASAAPEDPGNESVDVNETDDENETELDDDENETELDDDENESEDEGPPAHVGNGSDAAGNWSEFEGENWSEYFEGNWTEHVDEEAVEDRNWSEFDGENFSEYFEGNWTEHLDEGNWSDERGPPEHAGDDENESESDDGNESDGHGPPPQARHGLENARQHANATLPTIDGERPTDPDEDGLAEDVNANNRTDSDDVVTFFEHVDTPAVANNTHAFDFNRNNRTDYDDVVTMFDEL